MSGYDDIGFLAEVCSVARRPRDEDNPQRRWAFSLVVSLGVHALVLLTLVEPLHPGHEPAPRVDGDTIALTLVDRSAPLGFDATEVMGEGQGHADLHALEPTFEFLAPMNPDALALHRQATSAAVDLAAAPADWQLAEGQADATPAGEQARADTRAPAAAVPPATLPAPAMPQPEAVEPPPEEPEEDDTPEPEEEPPVERDMSATLPYRERLVHTDDGVEPPNDDAALVSAYDRHADRRSREAVTSEYSGEHTPPVDGHAARSGSPVPLEVDGPEPAQTGAPEAAQGGGMAHSGQGHRGRSRGAGAPTPMGTRAPGGPAAGPSAGAPAQPQTAELAGGPAARPGFQPGPDPERVATEGPSWWQPMAVRITVSSPRPTPPASEAAPTQDAEPVDVAEQAVVEQPQQARDMGGSDAQADAPASPSEPDEAPEAPETPDDSDALADLTVDPVDDLRAALGWAPLDRSSLAVRPGRDDGDGIPRTSNQVVIDDPGPLEQAIDTRSTARGAYIQGVDTQIKQRWYTLDLDTHHKAIGIQGRVTVDFRVLPNGKVRQVRILTSSGNLALDRMALESIPKRLPRFPDDLASRWVDHDVTLIYRNPFIAAAGSQ